MTKKFCDRCKKEIKPKTLSKRGKVYDVWLRSELEEFGYINTDVDLCFECANKLKKFLSGKGFEDG